MHARTCTSARTRKGCDAPARTDTREHVRFQSKTRSLVVCTIRAHTPAVLYARPIATSVMLHNRIPSFACSAVRLVHSRKRAPRSLGRYAQTGIALVRASRSGCLIVIEVGEFQPAFITVPPNGTRLPPASSDAEPLEYPLVPAQLSGVCTRAACGHGLKPQGRHRVTLCTRTKRRAINATCNIHHEACNMQRTQGRHGVTQCTRTKRRSTRRLCSRPAALSMRIRVRWS